MKIFDLLDRRMTGKETPAPERLLREMYKQLPTIEQSLSILLKTNPDWFNLTKEEYENNIAYRKQWRKNYYKKNKEKILELNKKWNEKRRSKHKCK